jgi:site-specific recombinase XerD
MHALRHSAAARMIAAGWSPTAVQRALGHRSASFTLTTYGHLFDTDWDDLGAALYSFPRRTGAVQDGSDAQEANS